MTTVAKLIDTSTCIGCKACEAACQEWHEHGYTISSFDGMRPSALSSRSPSPAGPRRTETYMRIAVITMKARARKELCVIE